MLLDRLGFLTEARFRDKCHHVHYETQMLDHMGHGSGGASQRHDFWISRRPIMPASATLVSEMYESDFTAVNAVAEYHTFLEVIRRTFQSRIDNPIGKTFVAYPLEPLVMSMKMKCQSLLYF